MNLLYNKNYVHLFFISLLAIHYVVPIIFIGQVAVNPHDNLDGGFVYDHIISEIYNGNFESINYFLAGQIKWYYLEELFYPTNVLHYFLNDKLFYFSDGILKKLFAYFSFYLLAKSLGNTRFNSALGGILYSTIVNIPLPIGLGLVLLPYILYLLVKKNLLNKKHYFFLFLIGLNSSLIQDFFAIILLIPLSFILKSGTKNLQIYFQVFSTIIIALILSNIHLVMGSILSDPIHRSTWISGNNIISPFAESFQDFFTYGDPTNILFIFRAPLTILTVIVFFLSFFSKQKNVRLLSFFIIFILILSSLVHHNIIDNILIGVLDIFKGFNFQRLDRILPVTFTLLLISFIFSLKNIRFKKFLYLIALLSILTMQLKTPLPVIGQNLLQQNMYEKNFNEAKKYFLEKKYNEFFAVIVDKRNFSKKKTNSNNLINKTFDNYYKFEDYAFIRNIVKNSRVMSVGLDPMVAVMNNIKVIDGYHNIYPLNYKIKFRKIIEKELEKNLVLKNYYDDWGSRVYAFYSDKNNIDLNFQSAKTLGADYVISGFPIKNNDLKIICEKCNNSDQIFLYKIL